YLARDMTSPEGALWSATDADSPGPSGDVEGYAFTWTPAEVTAAAGADAPAMLAFYAIDDAGELDGRNILHVPASVADVATRLGVSPEALGEQLARGRRTLLAARAHRPQ